MLVINTSFRHFGHFLARLVVGSCTKFWYCEC